MTDTNIDPNQTWPEKVQTWLSPSRQLAIKRWLVLVACVVFASYRLFEPAAVIDWITVAFLALAAFILLIPNALPFLRYIEKLKIGDNEIQLRKEIVDLSESVEHQEPASDVAPDVRSPGVTSPTDGPHISNNAGLGPYREESIEILKVAGTNPRAGLMLLMSEFERVVLDRLAQGNCKPSKPMPLTEMIRLGEASRIFAKGLSTPVRTLLDIRNRVAHGRAFDVSDDTIMSAIGTGLDLMAKL